MTHHWGEKFEQFYKYDSVLRKIDKKFNVIFYYALKS